MSRKFVLCMGLLVLAALVVVACTAGEGSAGPQGPQGPPGPQGNPGPSGEASASDLSCTECHNDEPLIFSKRLQWEQSTHALGGAYERGTSSSCAGCHDSQGFSTRIAAGLDPNEVTEGNPSPAPQNCRTCHQVHTTYTAADFALETIAAVELYQSGGTFDMGLGNLCANCHQPREAWPGATNGEVEFTSTRFGPHHGMESSMLLGVGGALVDGSPSAHYTTVTEGCPACHMGEERDHTMEPAVERCQACHADLESFDRNGVQTEIEELTEEVRVLLVAEGLLTEEGRTVPGTYPEAIVAALWNYKAVIEDASKGVHNSQFARALLAQALEALQ